MAENDDRSIPQVTGHGDVPTLQSLNEVLRTIFTYLHYLEGRLGQTAIRAALTVDGDVSISSPNRLVLESTYAPATGANAGFRVLTTDSSVRSGTFEGLRRATWNFFDTNPSNVDNVLIMLDIFQSENPTNDIIRKTGIHVKAYTMPDNGGDTSAGLFVQTGGGGALTCYKIAETHRPTNSVNYWDSLQGALEAGTSDGSQAILAIAGAFSSPRASTAVLALVTNAGSNAFLAQPSDGVFDSRNAYTIGVAQTGADPVNVTFQVKFSGHTDISGNEANNQVGAGYKAALRIINRNVGAAGRLAELQFGTTQTSKYAAISGALQDASNNTAGDIILSTRGISTDTDLLERVRLRQTGSLLLNTVGLATTETNGFLYIPSCAGTPTGVPTTEVNGIPLVYDRTNNILYAYSGGAWRAH